MTPEEHDKIEDVHDFLFRPAVAGQMTRAQKLDDLLNAVSAGKLGARVVLWLAGAIVGVAGALAILKGWGK